MMELFVILLNERATFDIVSGRTKSSWDIGTPGGNPSIWL